MPSRRYVILYHKLSDGEHWDLMLELDNALATWQLPAAPTDPLTTPLVAIRIGDHRKAYLDHEGPLSGNRGHVSRYDQGTLRLLNRQPDRWLFELRGNLLLGHFTLTRSPKGPAHDWLFSQA